MAGVRRLLEQDGARLVTLTGPGGTGKTRLALQVAAELLDAFPDGAWFAGLASLTDPGLVVPAIAQPLGVREAGHEPLEATLADYLRDKRLLLLLDNFEHVLAAAPAVGRLLAECRGVQVLATSRAALRVYGEREVPVPPLGLPDPRRLPPVEDLAAVPAVALFVARTQAVRPGFELTAANAAAVAGVCSRLEGLPLAIELAAARARILPPDKLLERLTSRLGLLTGGAVDRDERQRTLRGAIAWSYDLLPPAEQTLFRRLAAFAGATFEAIEAVCAADAAVDALDGLEALVQQSLLRQEEQDDGPRFFMLETIREFATERLEESGEAAQVRRAHAAHFLALADRAEPELTGPDQAAWLDRLEAEHDNLRASLTWLLADGGPGEGLRLAAALWRFWWTRGHLSEGREWLNRLLRANEAGDPAIVRRAHARAAALATAQGDPREAERHAETALSLARAEGDRDGVAVALVELGSAASLRGHHERAAAAYEESLRIYRELGVEAGVLEVLNELGTLAYLQGDFVAASGRYQEVLERGRDLAHEQVIVSALTNLGDALRHAGDRAQANGLFVEALVRARELDDRQGVAAALAGLGTLARDEEDVRRAADHFAEALDQYRTADDAFGTAICLEGLAWTLLNDDPELATRLLGTATALREAAGAPLPPPLRAHLDQDIESLQRALEPEAFALAWTAGRLRPLGETIEFARKALAPDRNVAG